MGKNRVNATTLHCNATVMQCRFAEQAPRRLQALRGSARAAASCAIAFSLAAMPLAAGFAAEEPDTSASSASTSSASSDSAADDSDAYAYEGTYTGFLAADGFSAEVADETAEATDAGQSAALAQNGGMLSVVNGKLVKTGDTASADDSASYGVNSIALAVNESSLTVLNGTALESAALGASALFATDAASLYANEASVATTADDSRGVGATYRASVIANSLNVRTTGANSAGVVAGPGAGYASVANSTLATAGSESPLAHSAGVVELDNVNGTSSGSKIAEVEGTGSLAMAHSTLESTVAGSGADDPLACGVSLYRLSNTASTGAPDDTALFQAADSTIESSIESGSMFYLTNTRAKVVLSNTQLEFDDEKAKLLTASGNNKGDWGTSGRNGAETTFTGLKQKLKGDIEADSISTIDFYLLERSSWEGASSIVATSAGADAAGDLTVNIDGTSSWTVTEDSTVANLNIASGAKLVDTQGDSVKIVDADGLTLVDGASDVAITVTDDFTTSVKASSINELEGSRIDRTGFDSVFGVDTTYGTNGAESVISDEERVMALVEYIREWFANL